MNKNKIVSSLLILIALIVMVGSVFVFVSYATDILSAVVDFLTTNDMSKLSQCGAKLPTQFAKIKADFTTLILPSMYYGIPLLLILVSILMFFAGFFFNKARTEDEIKNREEIERDMIKKATERLAKQKAKEAEEVASRALQEEMEQPKPVETAAQPAQEKESDMFVRKRRK